ncbi:MAG: bifunctional folylpolyglutamate synthase/dihydrofolate synthase [Sulfurospirillum sp.]|nr:bifunctional folylpolyglutamate synthase/dihydrofolate synthase [Sulfurospirillum sp.]
MQGLDEFLAQKPLYYSEINYERFPKIFATIKQHFNLSTIIHIIGTNAKGTTGRALAHILHVSGQTVGHYSSPHIVSFNERIWLNGADVSDIILEQFHAQLWQILTIEQREALSYFEYTTLLAMLIFSSHCKFVVLEAGLGGEHDATSVFAKELSIITPIGYDHQDFLGTSIEMIATTKINSIKNDAIIAKQYEPQVYEIARKRVETLHTDLYFAASFLQQDFYNSLFLHVNQHNYPAFLYDNFCSAFCAFSLLGFTPDVSKLEGLQLFGRCQKIAQNVTIDVGHNIMAAKVLAAHFSGKKVVLIYNTYKDKDFVGILEILQSIILRVEILHVSHPRMLPSATLEHHLKNLDIDYGFFTAINTQEDYLVFGSFSVVATFLKEYGA